MLGLGLLPLNYARRRRQLSSDGTGDIPVDVMLFHPRLQHQLWRKESRVVVPCLDNLVFTTHTARNFKSSKKKKKDIAHL